MRGRGTKKVVTWCCDTCGNNGIKVVKAIHNRYFSCGICGDFVLKNSDYIINGEFVEMTNTVERIAEGWG